jgi:Asp-tRNAAsn/Glu-tRNAGln amidotransferase A subunit and related amidases
MKAIHPLADAADYCRLTAAELTSLYVKRQISPVDVISAVLERAHKVNEKFNAFVLIDAEAAMKAARKSEARWGRGAPVGPLDGVPATIKNLVSVRGWPLRLGSLTTTDEPATEDAPTAASLRRAGAILFAATTTCEFGWKGVADSPLSGLVRNPWNAQMTSGGSSGGAAIAAATGCGVMHLGSDGGGSIRIPASFTGVVGHKPSFGRVPYFPPSVFGTVGHLGPITRTVADSALMLDVLSARDIRDWHQNPLAFPSTKPPWSEKKWEGARIALWTEMPGVVVNSEVMASVEAACRSLQQRGAIVERVALPGENLLSVFNVLWFAGAAARVARTPEHQRRLMDPGFLRAAEQGASYSAAEFVEASSARAVFGIAMDKLLQDFDLVVSPATPVPAFDVGNDVPPGSGQQFWTQWASFNFPLNLSQQPACSLPCGFTESGLPISLQLIGPRGDDASVLAAASALERILRESGAVTH